MSRYIFLILSFKLLLFLINLNLQFIQFMNPDYEIVIYSTYNTQYTYKIIMYVKYV